MIKKLFSVALLIVAMAVVSGCTSSSDSVQRNAQEQILQEATRQTGMPNIKNFFERKTLKTILEMRDDPKLTTYSYVKNVNGKYVYLGRSIGFGIPYATQFTNPEKWMSAGGTLPQADPNALFSPTSADATWVILVDENTNEPEINYIEDKLYVKPTKLAKRMVEDWSLPANY